MAPPQINNMLIVLMQARNIMKINDIPLAKDLFEAAPATNVDWLRSAQYSGVVLDFWFFNPREGFRSTGPEPTCGTGTVHHVALNGCQIERCRPKWIVNQSSYQSQRGEEPLMFSS